MEVGIDVGIYGALATPKNVIGLAQFAESRNYHSIWLADHIVFPSKVSRAIRTVRTVPFRTRYGPNSRADRDDGRAGGGDEEGEDRHRRSCDAVPKPCRVGPNAGDL